MNEEQVFYNGPLSIDIPPIEFDPNQIDVYENIETIPDVYLTSERILSNRPLGSEYSSFEDSLVIELRKQETLSVIWDVVNAK